MGDSDAGVNLDGGGTAEVGRIARAGIGAAARPVRQRGPMVVDATTRPGISSRHLADFQLLHGELAGRFLFPCSRAQAETWQSH